MEESQNSSIGELIRAQLGVESPAGLSPYGNWLGGKLVTYEPGKLEKEYMVRKEMTNAMGTLHGGVTAGILDEIIGFTLFSLEMPTFGTTVNLIVDYFYPAYENQVLLASATVIKKGSKIVHLQGELFLKKDHKLLARAITNMFITDLPIELKTLQALNIPNRLQAPKSPENPNAPNTPITLDSTTTLGSPNSPENPNAPNTPITLDSTTTLDSPNSPTTLDWTNSTTTVGSPNSPKTLGSPNKSNLHE